MTRPKAVQLKELRENLDWSQKKISEYLGVPLSIYTDWERGVKNPPEYVFQMIKNILQYHTMLMDTILSGSIMVGMEYGRVFGIDNQLKPVFIDRFSGNNNNLLILGGPGAGKSEYIRRELFSLCSNNVFDQENVGSVFVIPSAYYISGYNRDMDILGGELGYLLSEMEDPLYYLADPYTTHDFDVAESDVVSYITEFVENIVKLIAEDDKDCNDNNEVKLRNKTAFMQFLFACAYGKFSYRYVPFAKRGYLKTGDTINDMIAFCKSLKEDDFLSENDILPEYNEAGFESEVLYKYIGKQLSLFRKNKDVYPFNSLKDDVISILEIMERKINLVALAGLRCRIEINSNHNKKTLVYFDSLDSIVENDSATSMVNTLWAFARKNDCIMTGTLTETVKLYLSLKPIRTNTETFVLLHMSTMDRENMADMLSLELKTLEPLKMRVPGHGVLVKGYKHTSVDKPIVDVFQMI